MNEGARRLAWFVAMYLGGLAAFAAAVYGLRGFVKAMTG